MTTIYIKTLGCKVNSYDSQALACQLTELGYQMAVNPEEAEIMILNTCSVTHNAAREAHYIIRKMARAKEGAMIVATGCYAQTNPADLQKIDEVHFVAPNSQKEQLAATIDRLYKEHAARRGHGFAPSKQGFAPGNELGAARLSLTPIVPGQTRAYLRIQDGCESFCSYCIIPYARGRSRSVPAHEIISEVTRLQGLGIKEIVFTGIHLGNYGKDLLAAGETQHLEPLAELTRTLAESVLADCRIRFSSIEPMEVTDTLLAVAREFQDKICAHFHMPLQSGSDRILQLMNRPYSSAAYLERCRRVREFLPLANITTDVIVGFPGETDEDFTATCRIAQLAGISKIHVFPYSVRQGTKAARMPDHLDPAVIATRARQLREQSEQTEREYAQRFSGFVVNVLWENSFDDKERRIGRTAHYLEVVADCAPHVKQGESSTMRIREVMASGMLLASPLSQ
jgi:threonylcarbamoyladenosine tRNA methylthiotransferase MtaB